jgi:hypothetical protein
MCSLAAALSLLLVVAWQGTIPLSLSVEVHRSITIQDKALNLTFVVVNLSGHSLEDIQVHVVIPEQTVLMDASADSDRWAVRTPPRGEGGTVYYRALTAIASRESARLDLAITVLDDADSAIALNDYAVTAKGVERPVVGEPMAIRIDTAPTPVTPTPSPPPTATAIATPIATATATSSRAPTGTVTPTATPSLTPSSTSPVAATVTPSPTTAPSATPSPTITVVIAELPPTPTPNLTTEQERVGSFTVLVFVGFVLVIVVLSVIWLVRRRGA